MNLFSLGIETELNMRINPAGSRIKRPVCLKGRVNHCTERLSCSTNLKSTTLEEDQAKIHSFMTGVLCDWLTA